MTLSVLFTDTQSAGVMKKNEEDDDDDDDDWQIYLNIVKYCLDLSAKKERQLMLLHSYAKWNYRKWS